MCAGGTKIDHERMKTNPVVFELEMCFEVRFQVWIEAHQRFDNTDSQLGAAIARLEGGAIR